jgi:plasmid stability protein
MTRRMTIVFDDEELYTALKVAAARSHRPAKDLVADALQIMFEASTEEHDTILMRARMKGYARQGGTPVEKILEELGLTKDAAARQ